MKVLDPLTERALELYPKLVGEFLRTGRTENGETEMKLIIDGKRYILRITEINNKKIEYKD